MVEQQFNRLRSERTRRGWSQAALSRLSGIRQPILSTYERGVFPKPANAKKLADAFGVQVHVVYRWLMEPAKERAA